MSDRVTQQQVEGAFRRLHRAMEWPAGPHYSKGEDGRYHANIGAVALCDSGYGFDIQIIANEDGGVHSPFMGWRTKREAYNTMAAMAAAVETYKRAGQ